MNFKNLNQIVLKKISIIRNCSDTSQFLVKTTVFVFGLVSSYLYLYSGNKKKQKVVKICDAPYKIYIR